jgi:hypothetical protein
MSKRENSQLADGANLGEGFDPRRELSATGKIV